MSSEHISQPKRATPKDTVPVSRNIKGLHLKDFFVFHRLPSEIQDYIWEYACYNSPRAISAVVTSSHFIFKDWVDGIPGVLHATSGSRGIALKHFTLVKDEPLEIADPAAPAQQPNIAPQAFLAPAAPIAAAPVPMGAFGQLFGNAIMAPILGPGGQPPQGHQLPGGPVPLQNFWNFNPPNNNGWAIPQAQANGAAPGWNNTQTQDADTEQPLRSPYAYFNFHCDIVKLQMGQAPGIAYPTFTLEAEFAGHAHSQLQPQELQSRLGEVRRHWHSPIPFPGGGTLPGLFPNIVHIMLPLLLPPSGPLVPKTFKVWAEGSVANFCDEIIKPILQHFPSLKSLDLFVEGGKKLNNTDSLVLRECRAINIRESDGFTMSPAMISFLDMEVRKFFWGEFGMDNKIEVRIVGWLPDRCEKINCIAGAGEDVEDSQDRYAVTVTTLDVEDEALYDIEDER